MEMENKKLARKWHQAVGSIKHQWGKLSDQDLEKVKGRTDQLIGLIEEKYGEKKESVEKKINQLLDKL